MIKVFCLLFLCAAPLFAEEPRQKIIVNNRVLASVNGKIISVIDIMKKMDMIFYRQYPQYLEVPEARYQFYQTTWKQMLSDLVDRELVIADAEAKSLIVSSGDVREELEDIFGPNMMVNLDSAGLTLDEAWQIVKADITIRRMLYYSVQFRIYPQITPQDVRKKYEEYVSNRREQDEYVWKAISIRADSQEQAVAMGEAAHSFLINDKVPSDSIQDKLKDHKHWSESVTVSVSPEYSQKRKELSGLLVELFSSMEEGTYSLPQFLPSRSDRSPMVRLYYLQQLPKDTVAPIQEMELQLRDEIADQMIEKGTADYFARLRRHYHVSKEQVEAELPPNFQPFELR